MKWMVERNRLPAGLRRHIREQKSREQLSDENFRDDSGYALEVIGRIYFGNKIPEEFVKPIIEWWRIRSEYAVSGDEERFKDIRDKFGKQYLDHDDKSRLLSPVLSYISSIFAKNPGRGR